MKYLVNISIKTTVEIEAESHEEAEEYASEHVVDVIKSKESPHVEATIVASHVVIQDKITSIKMAHLSDEDEKIFYDQVDVLKIIEKAREEKKRASFRFDIPIKDVETLEGFRDLCTLSAVDDFLQELYVEILLMNKDTFTVYVSGIPIGE